MSTARFNTLQNAAGSKSVPVNTVVDGSAKAWVNFNGTFATSPFTVANGGIRAAFNVSSITDNGTGNYTINFTTAMVDANYSAIVAAQMETNNVNFVLPGLYRDGNPFSAGSVRVGMTPTGGGGGGNVDGDYICVAIFR